MVGGEIPFGQIERQYLMFVICQVKLAVQGLIPIPVLHMFFTESLILAQDERWRRA